LCGLNVYVAWYCLVWLKYVHGLVLFGVA